MGNTAGDNHYSEQQPCDREVEEQEATINQLKSMVAEQPKDFHVFSASLKEQVAQVQKASDKLRAQSLALRVVANN